MLKFKGEVVSVEDGIRDINDKDKDGNKLPTTHKVRMTNIVMIVKDGYLSRPLICKGFGLPDSFKVPKMGDTWETPEVQNYQAKFKAVPECNIN